MPILQLSLKLLLMSLLGYVVRKTHIVEDPFVKPLSRLLIDVIIPCYVLRAILETKDLPELIAQNGSALISALMLMGALFLIGLAGRKLLPGGIGRIFHFGTMFSNALIFGMPIAEACWGTPGLIYLMTFYIPVRLGYYGLSQPIICPDRKDPGEQLRHALRSFVSPAILAYMAGLLLLGLSIQVPEIVLDLCSTVGACCTPLGMMLIGMTIGAYPLRQVFSWKNLLLTLYKLVLLPALVLIGCLILGVGGMPAMMAVLYAALPCGSLLTTFCIQYDPDPSATMLSAGWVLLTTACAVFTVPLWFGWIERYHLLTF